VVLSFKFYRITYSPPFRCSQYAATTRSLSHLNKSTTMFAGCSGGRGGTGTGGGCHSLMGPTTSSMMMPFGLWKAGAEDEWTTADRSRRPPSRVHASTTVHSTVSMPGWLHFDRGRIADGLMDWGGARARRRCSVLGSMDCSKDVVLQNIFRGIYLYGLTVSHSLWDLCGL
jgi:hypothetical protein